MAILTALVIATLIITGAYVGYHAYEASLHEEPEKHSVEMVMEPFQTGFTESQIQHKTNLNNVVK